MMGSKEQLFSAMEKRSFKERLPDSDVEVEFFELSIRDRDDYIALCKSDEYDADYRAAFVFVRSCPILDDDDIPHIREKLSPHVIGLYSFRILSLSGMLTKDLDAIAKKLESGLS